MCAVGHHDVGKIVLRLCYRYVGVVGRIERVLRGVMLSERVVGKQDPFFGEIGHHIVRPVHHGGGGKGKRAFAYRQRFSVFHRLHVRNAVHALQKFGGRHGAVYRGARFLQERGQRAAVVGLGVVHDNGGHVARRSHRGDTLAQNIRFIAVHRVYERERAVAVVYEIGVERYAAVYVIPVETGGVCIDGAHGENAVGYLLCFLCLHVWGAPCLIWTCLAYSITHFARTIKFTTPQTVKIKNKLNILRVQVVRGAQKGAYRGKNDPFYPIL